jgi:hydrophobic/amphiphilic exporter-1 (mainly G- bacteria), HAE1 family
MNNDIKNRQTEKLSEAFKKEEKSLIGFFIKRFRFTYLILIVIVLSGLISLFTIPKESEPEIEVPYAQVTTVYLGATPSDMEELVTDKLEDKIANLDDIKKTESSSGQGYSFIFVEFEAEADLEDSFSKLKDAVDEGIPNLPDEAETPTVAEVNINDFPIITYSLVGNYEYRDLKKYADRLKEKIEKVKGVSEAEIVGGLEREFQVIIDQTRLTQYNLSLSQVVGAISSSNFNLPAGKIEIDNYEYNITLKGKFSGVDDLDKVIITTYDNSPVFLRDIARVVDDFKEKESESKIAVKGTEATNTISLQVRKKTGGNILNIIDEVNLIIKDSNEDGTLPRDLQAIVTNDNSKFIKDDIMTLGKSGIQTIILITLILLMILSFRGAIITALTVPFAFFMTFILLKMMGMTINGVVLFSLVLSLGLMVDNAIVIIEGINEYVSIHKKNIYEAAILSVWNFKWAIISGTMTTIAAFFGMLFISGIMGQYMSIIPKTLIVTLLSSLFVALVIIPTLSARFIKIKKANGSTHRCAKRHQFIDKHMSNLQQKYKKFLNSVLPSKKKRRLLIASAWIAFVIALSVPAIGIMRLEMFPVIDFDYFLVNTELPTGSTLDATKKTSLEVEKIVSEIPELKNYVVNIGNSGSNSSSITVNLIDIKDRERASYEIAKSIRNDLDRIQGAIITTEELTGGPPSGAPVEVRVYGTETSGIIDIAESITKYFKGVDGLINVNSSIENAAGEFTFTVNKQKASYHGLSIMSIAGTIRNAIYGTKASTVNINDEDVDITVRYAKENFEGTNDLENILLQTPSGNNIPLKQIADLSLEPSLLQIKHRDGKELVTITADTEAGVDLRKVMSDFNEHKKTISIPDGFSVDIGGETEDIEQSYTDMFSSLIIAAILIYTILVLMFNSFKQPFIILFSLPLAVPGVILGLTLLGQPFSITAFVGIIALAGIVVNDSIILIDRINKNQKDGLAIKEAIIEGGISRMQPILVTSITTIAGIFPLYFANEMWRGLSLTVISGLTFSTVLILVIIPTMYYGMVPQWHIKRMRVFVLNLFLGVFGAGKFYLGQKKQGFYRLGMFLSGIVMILSGIDFILFNILGPLLIIATVIWILLDSVTYMITTNEEFEEMLNIKN